MNDYYRGYRHTQTKTYLKRRMDVVSVEESLVSEGLFTEPQGSTSPIGVKTVGDGHGTLDEATELELAAFDMLDDTLGDVIIELQSAVEKHSILRTPFNPEMDVRDAYIILAEEVGEVARGLTYDEGGDELKLYDELVQVAAMASAMATAIYLRIYRERTRNDG